MTINAVLEWGVMTASLCNAMLLIWLGMTVLLNSERRRLSLLLTAGAMGSASLFFLFHAAAISFGLDRVSPGIIARWPLVWVAGFVQPCAWYLVMLWFGGYWTQRGAVRHHRWHTAVLTALAISAGTILVLAFLFPMSPWRAYPPAALLSGPMFGQVPALAVLYVLMVVGCNAMALDILLFPAPSSRLLGDLARRRARPWLAAASLMLLLVSLLVGWALLSIPPAWLDRPPSRIPAVYWQMLVWSDVLFTLLTTIAVLLLGQAVIAYELFTGTTLPRSGLRRLWRNAIIMGLVFGGLMALALVRHTPPIYTMMAISLLLTAFYALHNWRTFAERERFMSHLRPFIAGPRLTEALQPGEMPELTATQPFHALCNEVLEARWACLTATGPFAALVTPLTYPEGTPIPEISAALLAQCSDPATLCLPVTLPCHCEARAGEGECAAWAIPLWSTRGLIGLLLLGEKRDGGLYTHEEMEVARTAGERLIDTLAGAQMARRLMQVQRARLAEDQLADRRTRRIIHDDILPQIHTLLLALSADPAQGGTVTQLTEVHHALAALLRDLPATAALDIAHHGVVGAVRAHIERTHEGAFTAVDWQIDPGADARIRTLSPLVAEVIYGAAGEAVRNAARYARGTDPTRPLTLTVRLADTLPFSLIIADDGIGLSHAAPSVGTGQGILLHSAMMAIIGGAWNSESDPNTGTSVTLTLPKDSPA
ncbi:MAG: sensor histidine kinase [Armatimonadota bacterium]